MSTITTTLPNFQFSSVFKENLEKFGTLKTFNEGDVILEANANIRSIPFVKTGSMRVMRTDEDGHEILLYYIKAGESCIMSFLGGMHHETSKVRAVADEDVEVILLPIEKLNTLLSESSEMLDYIFRLYHKRFEELLEVVNAIAFKKMDERILNYLEEKKKITGSNEINITHQQLSEELGTARVVVSRLLKQMELNGTVILFRNKILLV
ncbi:Crp/Fnr family transcriptional regulator [Bacteroidota bacterium]|nr:Crp/Fnr family transcriptional regulator [Bacteroidota bacterium]